MKAIYFLSSLFVLSSCGFKYHDSISGNGKILRKVVSYDTIRRINISDNLDAVIIPSDSNKVVLNADENLHEFIELKMNNGMLNVSSTKYIRLARAKEILIYSKTVDHIQASARGSVQGMGALYVNQLDLICNTGSDISLEGRFEELRVISSSGSSLNLKGEAAYLNINASSGSDVYAYDLLAAECDVTASSGADVRVSVKDIARFSASSFADIKYKGDPLMINKKASSLADIRKTRI